MKQQHTVAPMSKSVGTRVYLTLKDWTRIQLEAWADQQGRPVANMASWLIERTIKDAIAAGEFEPVETETANAQNDAALLKSAIAYIQALASSGSFNVLEMQKLADTLQVPSERLAKILKQSKGEITNGNHH